MRLRLPTALAPFGFALVGACGQVLAPAVEATPDGGVGDAAVAGDGSVETDAVADGGDATDSSVKDGKGDSAPVVDKERYVFVTKGLYTGSALAGTQADKICNDEAKAGLAVLNGKTFIAWLSKPGQDVAARLAPSSQAYRRVDNMVVAKNFTALVSGSLQVQINADPKGDKPDTNVRVWTGTTTDGTAAANHCVGWTSGATGETGTYGLLDQTSNTWTNAGDESCDKVNRIYCIEE